MSDKKINYEYFYFGPFLYRVKLLNKEIDQIKKLCTQKKDIRKTLAGLIKKEFEVDSKKLYPIISPYLQSYIQAAQQHWGTYYGHKTELISSWVNYMTKYESNPIHGHSYDLSFVLYTEIPPGLKKEAEDTVSNNTKPGVINFVNKLQQHRYELNVQSFIPEVGDMFIFPGTLYHFVNSFQSEGERVSVSGNIKVV